MFGKTLTIIAIKNDTNESSAHRLISQEEKDQKYPIDFHYVLKNEFEHQNFAIRRNN